MRVKSIPLLWLPPTLFAGIIGFQLFGPVPVGLANNGDFARVLGSLDLWPAPQSDNPHALFTWFVDDYAVQRRGYDSGVPSSEVLVARIAKKLAAIVLPPGGFQLRFMGLIHAAILTLALLIFLGALRDRPAWLRFVCAYLLIFIWTDLEYVQQFNTAYTDAGAVVALGLVFSIAVHCLLVSGRWPWALAFALAGGFLIATKTQHGTVLPFLIGFCLLVALRERRTRDRRAWLAVPVLFLGIAGYMIARTPVDYRTPPAFTLVFYKLAPLSPDPKIVLADFRMPEDEFLKYVGHYWYEPGVPHDPGFQRRILSLVTPSSLASFYLHHPALVAKVLLFDLRESAPNVGLSSGYGHLREADIRQGKRPFELTVWSGFRGRLFALAPSHLIWLFGFAILGSTFFMLNPGLRTRLPASPLVLFFALLAVSSFLFASLLDAVETSRHLVFFQAATDLTIFSLVLSSLLWLGNRFPQSEGSGHAPTILSTLYWAAPVVFVLALYHNYNSPHSHPRQLTGTFDDMNSQIEYTGPWIHGSFAAAANGTTCYSNDTASRAHLVFNGTGITWVYAKAWNRGIVSVRIDGAPRGEFDLYSPTIVWQSHSTFNDLAPGDHILELALTGRKNPAATDQYMDIDALVVH